MEPYAAKAKGLSSAGDNFSLNMDKIIAQILRDFRLNCAPHASAVDGDGRLRINAPQTA